MTEEKGERKLPPQQPQSRGDAKPEFRSLKRGRYCYEINPVSKELDVFVLWYDGRRDPLDPLVLWSTWANDTQDARIKRLRMIGYRKPDELADESFN